MRYLVPQSRPAEVGKRSTDAQFFLRRLRRRNLTKKGSKFFFAPISYVSPKKGSKIFFATADDLLMHISRSSQVLPDGS